MGIGRIAVALAATAALTACASVVEGSPKGERPDPTKVAGLAISNGPSGPKAGVPNADLSVENGDGGEMDQLAINTLADVQEFWKAEIPASFAGKSARKVAHSEEQREVAGLSGEIFPGGFEADPRAAPKQLDEKRDFPLLQR